METKSWLQKFACQTEVILRPANHVNPREGRPHPGRHLLSRYAAALIVALFPALVLAQKSPPTIQSVWPNGGTRGTAVTALVDGSNLGHVKAFLFNTPGLTTRLVKTTELPNIPPQPRQGVVVTSARIEDRASRHRLTLEIVIAPEAEPGIHAFRIQTVFGTTNLVSFAVSPFPEAEERQSNNTLGQAQHLVLPVTVKGEISEPGDIDHFRFEATAGQELVFEILAAPLGSRLNSRLALLDSEGNMLAENDDFNGRDSVLTYTTEKSGTYCIRVTDAQMGSGDRFDYRLQAGQFPYITEVFPLGVRAGQAASLQLRGANLAVKSVTIEEDTALWARTIPVQVAGALNRVRAAVGSYPEALEREPNDSPTTAQRISVPVTVNGRVQGQSGEDIFQFSARKGQRIVLEVHAQRLGSALDSFLEILDSQGKPVPRAALRCLAQTAVTLNDPDSNRAGIRLENWSDFAIDDYVMIGGELLQVQALPRHPDDDMIFKNFRGRRVGFEDTTPEAHALGTPVYKVKLFPPGTSFPPNGMPIFQLHYRNDDGGPLHGRDSRLTVLVPDDGDYFVRLRDVRGLGGERYPYRLTVREARPDFVLFSDRENLNVPPGGQIPLTVTAYRLDGFEGSIEVATEGLPSGVTAGRGEIPPGSDSTVLLIRAGEGFCVEPAPFRIVGRARLSEGRELVRAVDVERRLSLVATSGPADIQMVAESRQVRIAPGTEVQVTVRVDRQNGFGARVPVEVRNLPHGVRVLDVGLNGVLITEQETSRTFTLYAEPWVSPLKQPFYAVGRVETNSFIPLEHASDPIELVVLPQRAGNR